MALFTITNKQGLLVLTGFTASTTTGDACVSPDLSPYNIIYYHNGAGIYPNIGDTVYIDIDGLIPAANLGAGIDNLQMSNLQYLKTDIDGVRNDITCR